MRAKMCSLKHRLWREEQIERDLLKKNTPFVAVEMCCVSLCPYALLVTEGAGVENYVPVIHINYGSRKKPLVVLRKKMYKPCGENNMLCVNSCLHAALVEEETCWEQISVRRHFPYGGVNTLKRKALKTFSLWLEEYAVLTCALERRNVLSTNMDGGTHGLRWNERLKC